MKSIGLVFASFAIVFLAGCATVISGTTQILTFDSKPQGAKIYLDGLLVGTTPFSMETTKNKYKSFRIEKEGYLIINREVTKAYDPVSLLNIFWDYSTTDFITGAMFQYSPGSYYIELQAD